MVEQYKNKYLDEVNNLGKLLNPNFINLFHIDKLNPDEKIYVFIDNGKVYGFLHISKSYETIDILNLIVDEKQRNHGVASLLMDNMISELDSEIKKVMLEVKATNYEAIKFYIRFNFKTISIRKKYYDGKDDAIIMERKIK
jgi:[ribosomal protein S18]-alanine N-acetyltransferase